MDERFAYHLRKPCLNRGINYGGYVPGMDAHVILNGRKFYTMQDAENYIEKFTRLDF